MSARSWPTSVECPPAVHFVLLDGSGRVVCKHVTSRTRGVNHRYLSTVRSTLLSGLWAINSARSTLHSQNLKQQISKKRKIKFPAKNFDPRTPNKMSQSFRWAFVRTFWICNPISNPTRNDRKWRRTWFISTNADMTSKLGFLSFWGFSPKCTPLLWRKWYFFVSICGFEFRIQHSGSASGQAYSAIFACSSSMTVYIYRKLPVVDLCCRWRCATVSLIGSQWPVSGSHRAIV